MIPKSQMYLGARIVENANGLLQVGSGDIHGFVLCAVRIADAGQHVCYGIGDLHVYILLIEVTGFTRGDPKVSGECAPL